MSGQIRISVQIQPHHQSYEALRIAWRRAEAMGVDALFNWDHLAPRFGEFDGDWFECWTSLSSMAEVTERVEIGSLVTVNAFRNPNLLADMARTVDHISHGRTILGLGVGGWDRDFEDAGYELGTAGGRLRDLERNIPIIHARWQAKNPKPIRGSIPILIGGNGERLTLKIVARHADIWNGQGDPDEVGRLNTILDGWCEQVERDPADIERSVLLIRPYQVDLAAEYLRAGFTHLIYSVRAPENDFTPVERLLAWRDEMI